MDPAAVLNLTRDGFLLLASVGAPLLGALLTVGLIVGVLQSATQINDPAVGFVPRIVTATAITWFLGPWILRSLASFFAAAVVSMAARQ
jgi:flagellar biosynthesis protein FliQ